MICTLKDDGHLLPEGKSVNLARPVDGLGRAKDVHTRKICGTVENVILVDGHH